MSDDQPEWMQLLQNAGEKVSSVTITDKPSDSEKLRIKCPSTVSHNPVSELFEFVPDSLCRAVNFRRAWCVREENIFEVDVSINYEDESVVLVSPSKTDIKSFFNIQSAFLSYLSTETTTDTKINITEESEDRFTVAITYNNPQKAVKGPWIGSSLIEQGAYKIGYKDGTYTYTFDTTLADDERLNTNWSDTLQTKEFWRIVEETFDSLNFICPTCESPSLQTRKTDNIFFYCTNCSTTIYNLVDSPLVNLRKFFIAHNEDILTQILTTDQEIPQYPDKLYTLLQTTELDFPVETIRSKYPQFITLLDHTDCIKTTNGTGEHIIDDLCLDSGSSTHTYSLAKPEENIMSEAEMGEVLSVQTETFTQMFDLTWAEFPEEWKVYTNLCSSCGSQTNSLAELPTLFYADLPNHSVRDIRYQFVCEDCLEDLRSIRQDLIEKYSQEVLTQHI